MRIGVDLGARRVGTDTTAPYHERLMAHRGDFGATDIARQNAEVLITVASLLARLMLLTAVVCFSVVTVDGTARPCRRRAEPMGPPSRGGRCGRFAPAPHRHADGRLHRRDARIIRALSRCVRTRGAGCGRHCARYRQAAPPRNPARRNCSSSDRLRCDLRAPSSAIGTAASSVSSALPSRSRPWVLPRSSLSAWTLGVSSDSQVIERRSAQPHSGLATSALKVEVDHGAVAISELVDIETVARLLGVGERYVRRMVSERRVPIVKVGHYVRFDLADIRKWVEQQRRPDAS